MEGEARATEKANRVIRRSELGKEHAQVSLEKGN